MSGRVLFIDAYDSFSNNIISLVEQELSVTVELVKIDDERFVLNDDAFRHFLEGFDAVICGPGPGHPANPEDVGLIAKVWSLPEPDVLPVLGICLGFQSLALSHGAAVVRLKEPRHGLITKVTHSGDDIFTGVGELQATQYHSLRVLLDPDHNASSERNDTQLGQLVPMAWDLSDHVNGPILMSVKHSHMPYFGVQFHPEAICTNEEGRKLVFNWWQQACAWNASRTPRSVSDWQVYESTSVRHGQYVHRTVNNASSIHLLAEKIQTPSTINIGTLMVRIRAQTGGFDPILLESGTRRGAPVNPETGRYSIIGPHDSSSVHIRYSTSSRVVTISRGEQVQFSAESNTTQVFELLEEFMSDRRTLNGPLDVPFWGGLIGFVSYEASLETIDVSPSLQGSTRPDLWFIFIERSIVIDHATGVAYIQSMIPNDSSWLESTRSLLLSEQSISSAASSDLVGAERDANAIKTPARNEYYAKVRACQSHLRAGLSYELCLTDQTTLRTTEDSWSLYERLRLENPAPFGAYLNFRAQGSCCGVSLVDSSPERFLSWSRDGNCQFRPIKGTVKKDYNMTRAKAEAILNTDKEQAENLMIVDLIRHDLAGVPGVRDVRVPKLMSVEEYETVYQLVSVIEGNLAPANSGVSVLAASLPPGSMTGAPKRRSCELLKAIEGEQPRGLYSGVLGYMDVGGGGDFSVVIRSAFKWEDEDVWRVGAGGAVTMLSTAEGEFEEMLAKRERLVDIFLT